MVLRKGKEMKKDISVDVLRHFGILLVVLGHMENPFNKIIYSFHVPLFFWVSGYFLKKYDDQENIFNKVVKILKNYTYLSLFSILLGLIKNYIKGDEVFSVVAILKGIVYGMDLRIISTYGFVLWFLLALFWMKFISLNILKRTKIDEIKIIILIIFLLGAGKSINIELPFKLTQGIIACVWGWSGYIYYEKYRKKITNKEVLLYIIFIIILTVVRIPKLDLNNLKFDSSFLYNYLYSIVLIITIDSIVKNYFDYNFVCNKLFSKILNSTLLIMVIHPYINNITYVLKYKMKMNWIFQFLVSVTIIYFLIFTKAWLERRRERRGEINV
jgi:fucose 4-O-acetylase-like acetyltransferase